eukprot:30840-Pelagococcus_subviridis.AAC.1
MALFTRSMMAPKFAFSSAAAFLPLRSEPPDARGASPAAAAPTDAAEPSLTKVDGSVGGRGRTSAVEVVAPARASGCGGRDASREESVLRFFVGGFASSAAARRAAATSPLAAAGGPSAPLAAGTA